MSRKSIQICNFIAENESDCQTLREYLGNYPVSISSEFPVEMYFDKPTLIIGWNGVKHRFEKQNILDKEIQKNLHWCFSKTENEKEFFKQVDSFFNESIKEWLPNKFKSYDSFLNKETLEEFIDNNIDKSKKSFIYFDDGAMYIFNSENNFIINIKSLFSVDSNFKTRLSELLNNLDTVIFSYHNISEYVDVFQVRDLTVIDSLRWVKFGVETLENYLKIIPNIKTSKYAPFLMSKTSSISLDDSEAKYYARMCQRDRITCWLSGREIAFRNKFENSRLKFKSRKNFKLAKIHYSSKRTITGRINAADESKYNPQMLNKSNDEREDIISRFEDGKILVFDYVSFETKISLYLCEDESFIRQYENKDLHYETAVRLFDRAEIIDEERSYSKVINHSLLYGASEETMLQNLAKHFKNPEEKLYHIRQFLNPIIKHSSLIKNQSKSMGYMINPWGYIVRAEKEHASYHNYISCYASEIVVDKLFEIKDFLKPYKTQFIFQVHDSLVFDFHPEEVFLIDEIKSILSKHNDMDFSVNHNSGKDFKSAH